MHDDFPLVSEKKSKYEFEEEVTISYEKLRPRILIRILPLLCIGFIVSVLDRNNFGNVHLILVTPPVLEWNGTEPVTYGNAMLSEFEYGWAGSVFSIGYIIFEVPSNMLLKVVGARFHFARICFLWGVISMCMMFITNGTGAIICRLFLGIAEAGYFPGVIYYLSCWFLPDERAQILSYFYIGIPIAGCISGLLGYGLLKMDGIAGLGGWRWLFLL
jgi:MFS family permease